MQHKEKRQQLIFARPSPEKSVEMNAHLIPFLYALCNLRDQRKLRRLKTTNCRWKLTAQPNICAVGSCLVRALKIYPLYNTNDRHPQTVHW